MIEHRPADHVRQENVQRNGAGVKFACQRERFASALSATDSADDADTILSLTEGYVLLDAPPDERDPETQRPHFGDKGAASAKLRSCASPS